MKTQTRGSTAKPHLTGLPDNVDVPANWPRAIPPAAFVRARVVLDASRLHAA